MATTLLNRALQFKSPLGKDVLLPRRIRITENLSQPFEWTVDFASESGDIAVDQILGKDVTLSFKLPTGGATRYFHGFVTEFSQSGYLRRLHEYRAVVRPWLWFLTRTADCRIFQNKSIPDIFEEVVKQYGLTDYQLKLTGNYRPWEYCVQYRETDFNFISRLLEQEGIHYFFEHSDGRHVMVLCDDSTASGTVPDYAEVPFFPPDASLGQSPRDHFSEWSATRTVLPGAYATTDYDFEAPRKPLTARSDILRSHARADFEIFDFPAELALMEASESQRLTKIRIEELQAGHLIARGQGDAAGVAVGRRFQLIEHPRRELNIEYLITSASYAFHADAYDAGDEGAGIEFAAAVEAIDATTPYRPRRSTPKPLVQGAQTATVVGKAGEEIDTDRYGRVKIQFPWDRYGKSDENSSCWVRVAQVWAGKNWGAIHIPRIGQEVLVSFLEGDPDRPIISGRVYNGDCMPPYDLPANATQSGIKSRSSKDGSADNFNEIRFEDRKGSEEVYLHAERNLRAVVENDQSISIGHDESVEIGNDRSSKIGNNESLTIGKDRDTTVGNSETRTVGTDRTTDVGQNETLNVGQNQSTTVGKRYVLTAGDEIVLETGASSLVMKKDGTIKLKGVNITIDGSDKITQKAGQKIDANALTIKLSGTKIDIKGTKTTVQGTLLDLSAAAVAKLKGAITKIG